MLRMFTVVSPRKDPLQVKYSSLPNFEEREEDFRAESVLLRRRFTEDGGRVGRIVMISMIAMHVRSACLPILAQKRLALCSGQHMLRHVCGL